MESLTCPTAPADGTGPASLPGGFERLLRLWCFSRIVRRREPVYSIGDPATHAYLLERGEITLSRVTAGGREVILETLGAGALFGETEMLLCQPRTAQALARTESVVCPLHRRPLLDLAARRPELSLWLMRCIGERQERLQASVETLLFTSARGKVAKVLLELAARHGNPTEAGVRIESPITHQEIGNMIAATRETVSATFMDFRERGLIATRRRKTIIRDPQALAGIALS